MHDIRHFTLKDAMECSGALRRMGADAASMEQTAHRIAHYFYDHFVAKETGKHDIVLVRLFKTHAFGELPQDLQDFAQRMLAAPVESPAVKCLTLLGSAGLRPQWSSRKGSAGHQAIPLPSERFIEKFPMVRQLVQQLGLEVNTVLQPDPVVLLDLVLKTYNIFFVPEAVGSQYVPAQADFVVPFGVRSVLGFGGMLPSGNLFAVIIFASASLSRETAEMFRTLALSVKLALLPRDGGIIFS